MMQKINMRWFWQSLYMCVCVFWVGGFAVMAQATPDQPNVTIHVVQRGETMFRIAQQYGLTYEQIASVNGITNPNNIQVGQRLLIPLTPVPEIVPPTEHTVQAGETLRSIAELYGVTEMTLVQLNGITNPNLLYLGQTLVIVPEQAILPNGGASTTAPVATIEVKHVVQRGETLFNIATRYGVTMAAIQEANEISNASVIYAGQTLIIPGVSPQSPSDLLPPAITSLDLTPLTLEEGKTSRVRISTRSPATLSAQFLEREFPVITLEDGVSFIVWLAAPMYTPGGIYPFVLTVTEASGETTVFEFNIHVESGSYTHAQVTLPEDKSELLSKAVEDNETQLLLNVISRFTPQRYFDAPMSLPASAPMNSPYGTRRTYNGGVLEAYHMGADFAGAPGSPVLAAAAGQVVLADNLHIRGTALVIDHGWGIYTTYSHMSQRNVNLGDFVQAGQVIGAVGTTGRSTGAHLHWEIWVNGVVVEPLQWVYQLFP